MDVFEFLKGEVGVAEILSAVFVTGNYIFKRYRPLFVTIEGIYCLNVLLQTILFITGVVDLANMLIVTQILLFAGLFISIGIVILVMVKNRTKERVLLIAGFTLFFILIATCIIGYVFGPIGFDYNLTIFQFFIS